MQSARYSDVLTVSVCVAMLRRGERVRGCGLCIVVCLGCVLVFPGLFVQMSSVQIEFSDVGSGGECPVTCGILLWVACCRSMSVG